jgi:hypothetical protein
MKLKLELPLVKNVDIWTWSLIKIHFYLFLLYVSILEFHLNILSKLFIFKLQMLEELSGSWLYGSWIYNYLCNQWLSPLTLWVWIPLMQGVLDTTLCDKVCQWLATGWWFSPGITVSSTNKTDRHDITEILVKVVLNTINFGYKKWNFTQEITLFLFKFVWEKKQLSFKLQSRN